MGAGYSRSCHREPPTVYILDSHDRLVPKISGKRHLDNTPIIKVEQLDRGSFRTTVRKWLARCSFSPGWIRYERLLESISELSHSLFDGKCDHLELTFTSPVKPLGMRRGDEVKNRDAKRYDVFAALSPIGGIVQIGGGKGGAREMIPTMQAEDWRRVDSRRIGQEARLRALEAVEKYLLGRKAVMISRALEAAKLGEYGYDGDEEDGEDVEKMMSDQKVGRLKTTMRTKV